MNKNKLSREDVIRKQFSENDCIFLLQSQGWTPDPKRERFDVWDQLLACESITKKIFRYADLKKKT